jgi:class 3 adenylate cyclase
VCVCGACGHPGRSGLRFCVDCGAALVACAGCGAAAEPGARFCGRCGRSLVTVDAPAPAPAGERKQVTVLFADVARSMELAERLEADEWSLIMQRLFGLCREAVERFGGTVDKFTGDGIMALFGAPAAQEDHARRACHAALRLAEAAAAYGAELHAARGVPLGVRVGLNSGEVVAGSAGVGAYTVLGHAVGLAQRMEGLAAPGGVFISEHTAALVVGEFRLRDVGRREVKGSATAVRVFALEAAPGGALAAGRRRAGSARLVGRESEVVALERSLGSAMEGRGRVVGIVGEAGAGKSRLCAELARRATGLGVTVRHTAGVSHAVTVPLLPILGLLRDYFTIAPAAAPAEARAVVESRLLGLDPAFAADLDLLFDFMEIADPARPAPQLGPEVRRRRVLDVLRRATARRSEREVVLLILEDLQWFDPYSVAFLQAWLPSLARTRSLVVTNFRPEFRASWMGHSYYRQLALAPLKDAAVDELLVELLGPDPAVAALAARLRDRAGGNPFFAEEIVRSLAGDGTLEGAPGAYRLTREVAQVRVPPTVQAILAARIDGLAVRDKAVLQAAAVLGRTFAEAALREVADLAAADLGAALDSLRAAELLQETGAPGEFRFWHPLTQEVAYGSLVSAVRGRLHRRTAAALTATSPDRLDELAALVATHYEAAGDHVDAARWQLRAGTRATRSDFPEARRRLRAAIGHAAVGPETEESMRVGVRARTLLLRFGARAGMDAAEADTLFAEARPAAERLGDAGLLCGLSVADGAARYWGGDAAGCLASWSEVRRQADRGTDRGLRAFAWTLTSAAYAYTGPLAEGLRSAETAVALCGGDLRTGTDHAGYSAHDAAHVGLTLMSLHGGRLVAAGRLARQTVALYRERPAAEFHAWTLTLFALIADSMGDAAQAEVSGRAANEALRLAEEAGAVGAEVKALQSLGVVALLGGAPTEAVTTLEKALAQARLHRSLLDEAWVLSYLARARLASADAAGARAAATAAAEVAARQGAKVLESLAHLVRARVWRETAVCDADLDAARVALAAGEALAAESCAATNAAFLAEERARLDDDIVALGAAADGYAAIGAGGHARRLRAELSAEGAAHSV